MITINPNTYNGFDILCRVYENQSQSYWRSANRNENEQICVEVLFACKTFPDAENKQATCWLPIGAAQFMIENIKDYIDKYNIAVCNELPYQVGVLTSCRENFDNAFERVCRENNYEL